MYIVSQPESNTLGGISSDPGSQCSLGIGAWGSHDVNERSSPSGNLPLCGDKDLVLEGYQLSKYHLQGKCITDNGLLPYPD